MKPLAKTFLLVIVLVVSIAWVHNELLDEDFYRLKLSPSGRWYYE